MYLFLVAGAVCMWWVHDVVCWECRNSEYLVICGSVEGISC